MQIRFRAIVVAAFLVGLVGCADGPFGLQAWNPYVRKQWAEDERFGPTFHRRLADLRGVRAGASRLQPQKREELAADMTQLLETEKNAVLRSEAVAILGELAVPSGTPALRAALQDADKDVRAAACRALAKIGGPDALNLLCEVSERESDIDVRLAALAELGQSQDQLAVAALGRALEDNDPAVQHRAVLSLKTATGKDFGDSVPAWRDFVQGREPSVSPPPSLVERLTDWF